MKRVAPALSFLALLTLLATMGRAVTEAATARPGSPASRDSRTIAVPKAKTAVAPPEAASAEPPRRNILYIDGLPDTAGVFLPDTTTLARVDDRPITVREFIDTYYAAYAPDRPLQDSTGRVEWLNSIVNKVVLGQVAREADRPFTFEDRLVLRDHSERVLSNTLFMRAVLDSITVSEAEVQEVFAQTATEYRLRRMLIAGAGEADTLSRDLAAKRIGWSQAYRSHSLVQEGVGPEGDIGWVTRFGMTWGAADVICGLKAGAISRPYQLSTGHEIYEVLETRKAEQVPLSSVRGWIVDHLKRKVIARQARKFQETLRAQVGLTYDSLNIAWAAPQFRPAFTTSTVDGMPSLRLNSFLPVFKPADTSRVLARYRDGTLTLSRFIAAYAIIPTTRRPDVSTPTGFRDQVASIILEPYRARLALERGLDKDPLSVALIEKERERILVEHLYRDSIEAKIFISKEQRQKYYKDHLTQFITFPAAKYAQLRTTDSLQAAALMKRLRSGERADAIMRADSAAGRPKSGWIKTERESDHAFIHGLVFENLKPGQCDVVGPDAKGRYDVIQLLSFDAGHQLTFEESDGYCSDALQSLAAEARLEQMIERHRRRHAIVIHSELVRRIRLVDPGSGQ